MAVGHIGFDELWSGLQDTVDDGICLTVWVLRLARIIVCFAIEISVVLGGAVVVNDSVEALCVSRIPFSKSAAASRNTRRKEDGENEASKEGV